MQPCGGPTCRAAGPDMSLRQLDAAFLVLGVFIFFLFFFSMPALCLSSMVYSNLLHCHASTYPLCLFTSWQLGAESYS